MQKNSLFKAWVAALMLIIGSVSAMAETTITSTFTDNNCSTSESDGAIWTMAHTKGAVANFAAADGIHIGSNNTGAEKVTFTSKKSYNNVSKVTVETKVNSKKSSTISVKVGETALECNGATTAKATSTSFTKFEFTGNASGVVTITIDCSTAVYVKSLQLAYNPSGKPSSSLAFAQDSYTCNVDEELAIAAPTSNSTGAITYTVSDNTNAGYTNGTFLAFAAGTYTITATQAETDDYAETTATTTVHVVAPIKGATALVAEKDGHYYAAQNTEDNTKFQVTTVNVANGMVYGVTDKAAIAWKITDKGNGLVTIQGADDKYLSLSDSKTEATLSDTEVTLQASDKGYETTGNLPHGFAYNAQSHIMRSYTIGTQYPAAHAMPIADYYRANLVVGDYGTICLPNAVEASGRAGATFYSVAGVTGTTLQLTEVTGTLEAGKPYLFQATGDVLTCVYTGEAVSAPVTDSYLVGTFTETTVSAANSFVLQKQDGVMGFYKVESVQPTLGANRAYLVYAAPAGVKGLTFGTATGIATVNGQQSTVNRPIYNLQGQRVSEATKGIFIINGKKVIK